MTNELCMNCFNVKGRMMKCPYCGYEEGTPPEQVFHLWPGSVLAERYIVGVCIGYGGFGITYKAYDTILGVIVAIKEFYPAGLVNRAPGERQVGLLSGDKIEEYNIQLRRFLLEAQSIAQFGKAKDIVNVYDYFEENGTAYIIMEYIDGILLKDYMKQEGKLDADTAVYLITPIIEALKKVHASGIIHRDVSPDNIFLTSDGAIKVFDFGAAILADEESGTASMAVIKAGYTPPEQYRSKSKQGLFSDVYSVGAILYEMVTGVKPMEASDRTVKDELLPPSQLGVTLDPNLDRAIMQAMAVRPEFRFQYVEHLQEAIEDKRMAEYPQEKLRRLRKKRRLAVSVSISVLLTSIVVALVLINRVRQGNEVLTFVLEPCELTIWVPYGGSQNGEDAQKQMELLVKDFKSNSSSFKGNDSISFQCKAVSAEQYAEEFQKAKAEGREPDIYCVDIVGEDESLGLEQLYDALDDEDYYGLFQYTESHRQMKSVPFGLRTLCVYSFDGKHKEKQTDVREILIEGNKKKIYLDEARTGAVLALQDPSLLKSSPIAVTDNSLQDFQTLNDYTNIMGLLENSIYMESSKSNILKTVSQKYNNEDKQALIIADTDFNKSLYNYNSKNYAQKMEYSRSLLTLDGTAIFSFCDCYAVSERLREDVNKALAAQRFLYLCLSQTENRVYYSGTSRVIPINRGAWTGEQGQESADYTDELLDTLQTQNVTPLFVNINDLTIYSENIIREAMN